MNRSKILGIGLSKTGTTSLNKALTLLGHRSIHFPLYRSWIDNNDAATDLPVALEYRELDKAYPGSRFILTIRDLESWLTSIQWQIFKRRPRETSERDREKLKKIAMAMYGVPGFDNRIFKFDRDRMVRVYQQHVNSVFEYFSGRKEDLLVMDICAGDGWKKLCPFLGKEIPKGVRFPHLNSRTATEKQ